MREGNVITIVGVIVLVVLLFSLLGGGMMGWGMMGRGHMWWWDGNGVGTWWGFGMMLVMMLFWVVIIVGVVLGIAWILRQGTAADGGGAARRDQALDILRERYARGEISKEEFDRMRRDLE
jgi:putative membrane protein